jgi:hypothetical protein
MITKILGGMMALVLMALLVLTGYTAYAQYWSWGALKRQEQRLQEIEKRLDGSAPDAQQSQNAPAQRAEEPKRVQSTPAPAKWAGY